MKHHILKTVCTACLLSGAALFVNLKCCGSDMNTLIFASLNDKETDKVTLSFTDISIDASLPDFAMNPADLVKVTPAVKGLHVEFSGSSILLRGDFEEGTEYQIHVSKDLKSTDGRTLKRDIKTVYRSQKQTSPALSFVTDGRYFPLHAKNFVLPLELTNISAATVNVYRILDSNMFIANTEAYYGSELLKYSVPVIENLKITLPKASSPGKKLYYNLELGDLIKDRKPGFYYVTLEDPTRHHNYDWRSYYNRVDERRFILSDLSAHAAIDTEMNTCKVFVHSLSTGKPLTEGKVKLISAKFQTAGEAEIKNGIAQCSYRLHPSDSLQKIVVSSGGDMLLLHPDPYTRHTLAGNTGMDANEGLCAMVYTERGIVRPGETFHATAMIRERKNMSQAPLPDAPVRFFLEDPSGKIIQEKSVKTNRNGFAYTSFALSATAMTGDYTVLCGVSEEQIFGRTRIMAAAFQPDRIKVELSGRHCESGPAKMEFLPSAKYYFGEDAGPGKWKFHLYCTGIHTPDHFKGWDVGNGERISGITAIQKHTAAPVPETIAWHGFKNNEQASNPQKALASFRYTENGGRSVSDSFSFVWHPRPAYVGMRPAADRKSGEKVNAFVMEFTLLPAEKDQTPEATEAQVTVKKVVWEYNVRRTSSGLRRDWERITYPVLKDKITLPASGVIRPDWGDFAPGEYEVTVQSRYGITMASYWHSAGTAGERLRDPNTLTFKTDKEIYNPGDVAILETQVPENSIILAASGEKNAEIFHAETFNNQKVRLMIPIRKNLESGTWHAAVTAISGRNAETRRSFGFVTLKVNQNTHKLVPEIKMQEKILPGEKVRAELILKDAAGNPQSGTVQVYAVDEGILSLTGYRKPDVFRAFYGPVSWNMHHYDTCGNFFPDLRLLPDGSIGGDTGLEAAIRKNLFDQTQKKSALFVLPPQEVTAEGKADITLPFPDHAGAMRIFAVAANGTQAGSSERSVILRAPAGVTVSAPVSVYPGDEFELTLKVFNHDLPESDYKLELSLPETLKAETCTFTGKLAQGKPELITIPCKAAELTGKGEIRTTVKMGGYERTETVPVTIRPRTAYMTKTQFIMLKPGESCEAGQEIGSPEKDEQELCIIGSMGAYAKPALNFLNSYPYGCAEQTTSAAFPFLAAENLRKAGLVSETEVLQAKDKLELAYANLMSMLRHDGSFSMWPGGSSSWDEATVYIAHFLLEADAKKMLAVSPDVKEKIRNWLKSYLSDSRKNDRRLLRAYACYALAVADDSSFLAAARNIILTGKQSVRRPGFSSMLAALAMIRGGYAAEGMSELEEAIDSGAWIAPVTLFSRNKAESYGMLLALLVENVPDCRIIPAAAAKLVDELRKNTGHVTQASAWSVMGLAALCANTPEDSTFSAKWEHRGNTGILHQAAEIRYTGKGRLTNTGKGTLFATVTTGGYPAVLPPSSGPIVLERKYYNANGQIADQVNHGDLVTVELHIKSPAHVENLVLCDVLPAGLEVEDERIQTRARALPQDWKQNRNITVKCLQKTENQVFLFASCQAGEAVFTYKARAVTKGKFLQGPVTAEDMYKPEMKGNLTVQETFCVK